MASGSGSHRQHSSHEFSAESYSRSKANDSMSDSENEIYVPFEYNGDGRKREAKKHKQKSFVARDEMMIDSMITDY